MTRRKRTGGTVALLALLLLCLGGAAREGGDLALTNVAVFDPRKASVSQGATLEISGGRIARVLSHPGPALSGEILEGHDRLLTPGLIDVHHHTAFLLGDSVTAGGGFVTHLSMRPDSIAAYRRIFARAYMPYGVTTVRDAGSAESDLPMLLAWMEPSPSAPDFHPVGGALVSREEGRTPYAGHAEVKSPEDAAARVRHYFDLGIRHLKLYWRLREPEFRAALEEGLRLDMNVTGHIDFHVLTIDRALDLGLRSFEHAYTIGVSALSDEEFERVWRERVPEVSGDRPEGRFYIGIMEVFNDLGPENPEMLRLIRRLAETNSTVVPTLHIFAQRFGLTPLASEPVATFDDTAWLTEEQRSRMAAGYRILAEYVRRMYEAGVHLAVGTDWKDPGRAVLSEMLLLHRAGIPMPEVLRIATLEGAQAIDLEDVGSVEPGKRANLVLFERNPLDDPENLLSGKVVIKDGVVWNAP
jgi:imidazolonepropionase-like amidohydrolase